MKNLATMMQGGSIPGMEGLEEGLKGGRKVNQQSSLNLLILKSFVSKLPKLPKLTPFYFKPYNPQSKHVLVDSTVGS